MKKLLRTDPRLRVAMHHASYSRARRHEKPVGQKSKGKGVERGFDVVMVELMLRKHALVKGCQSLTMLANRWQALAQEQVKRFPDAHTLIFLFDDETNVPQVPCFRCCGSSFLIVMLTPISGKGGDAAQATQGKRLPDRRGAGDPGPLPVPVQPQPGRV